MLLIHVAARLSEARGPLCKLMRCCVMGRRLACSQSWSLVGPVPCRQMRFWTTSRSIAARVRCFSGKASLHQGSASARSV